MRATPLFLAVILASACRPALESAADDKAQESAPPAARSSKGPMPSLEGATGWLQTEPLKATDLRGKVVLVDFWTYSCINWRRSLPYVRAWAHQGGGRVTYRFHARDLHLVMGKAAPGAPLRFRVLLDGHAPGSAHGTDVDEQGNGTVTEQRLYQLIRQSSRIEDRQFEIEFLDAGAEVFSFTFG